MYTGVNLVMFSLFTKNALPEQSSRADDHQMTRAKEHLVDALIYDSLRLLTMTIKTTNSTAEYNDCSADNSAQAGCIQNNSINIFSLIDDMRQVVNQLINNK